MAYRQVAKSVHPDKVVNETKSFASERFKILKQIMEVMSDEKLKKRFDATGTIVGDQSVVITETQMEFCKRKYAGNAWMIDAPCALGCVMPMQR